MKKIFLTLIVVFVIFIQPVSVFAQEQNDKWKVSLKPYLWLPTIEGDIRYTSLPGGSQGSPHASVDPDDLLENLDFGALMVLELRKAKWSIFSDFMYLGLSSSDTRVKAIDFGGTLVSSSLNLDTELEVDAFLTTIVGGYEVINIENFTMDLIGGVRYFWLEADLDWSLSAAVDGPLGGQTFTRTGSLTEDAEIWNGVGGVRGKIHLGDSNWYIPYYADIGAGDSELTWQVFSALGYSFEKWEFAIGYRHLVFEADDDSLVDSLSMSGPFIGASYTF